VEQNQFGVIGQITGSFDIAPRRRALSSLRDLEPGLMCSAALSFVGIKRIVYAALAEDANAEQISPERSYYAEQQ